MCRIAGIVTKNNHPLLQQDLLRMRDAMQHGGPDDAGLLVDETLGLALGHRRLSLIDLSAAGHQPLFSNDGNYAIVFNGEIYNYQEIKAALQAKGYTFRTKTDTEVIVNAYAAWGVEAFAKFNGMYVFAIWDKQQQELVLARDHAGIKPLYYSYTNNSFYFGSEIRSFKAVDANWPENTNWPLYFLSFGHLPEPVTTLQGVQPLPKGHYLRFNLTTHAYSIKSFYNWQFNYTIPSKEAAVTAIKNELTAAVQRHLIADAPIGLFLSGGVDSSLLTLLAAPHLGQQLKTLSIYFEEEQFSEKTYQDLIIEKTGAQHQSFCVTQAMFENKLPDIFEAMDQPSIDAINTYFISGYAHEYGLTAVLSGVGADELWYGYGHFRSVQRIQQLKRLPGFIQNMAALANRHSYKKISFLSLEEPVATALFLRGLYTPAVVASITGTYESDVRKQLNALAANYMGTGSGADYISWLETNFYMQNQLLKDADYMSMWHSLEIRVPFLDKVFMELAAHTSPQLKMHPQTGKYLLIEAFKEVLPEAIWNRRKQGFTFPFEKWLLASNEAAPVNKKEQEYFQQFQQGRINWSRYWSVCLLNRWNKEHASSAGR